MYFANEMQINDFVHYFRDRDVPVLFKAALTLESLALWTNHNSDGWAYWKKPMVAAKRLASLLENATNDLRRGDLTDITEAQYRAALTPIKAFLTRQGVAHSEVLDI